MLSRSELNKIRQTEELLTDEDIIRQNRDSVNCILDCFKTQNIDPSYIFEVLRRGYLFEYEKLELTVNNETIILENNGEELSLYKKVIEKIN
ncbi:hypothetical protein HYH85_18130 [Clostridium botulinum]|uniref:hypothetical protein n=1 Tax=Clostridium botulinum TaxID=1491 RepID=UPI0013F06909|nr:hypothetical protein [Clostridium botulinum]MBY6798132.1 hypothetical protein [Clostridium botulinum]MBY6867894.1 hypothetical protein [Clostridium botulinum]NFM56640.1 hypothetical protein [Clostridium botulinum]